MSRTPASSRLVRETEYARFGEDEVFLQLAPLSFDASTLEIWGPLLNGGRLVLAPAGPPSLAELGGLLAAEGVTSLWLTAGLFHEMVEREVEGLRPLRQLLAGGDVLRPSAVRRVLGAVPGLEVINGYGPTENTTFTACHRMAAPREVGEPVPIGRPIAGTRAYVVDAEGRALPAGVAGELLAGGLGLGRGYVNRPDLTAERWVPDGLSGGSGERLYRTGDLVRWRSDGALEFLGRLDGQVKVRGFRIEPGEVETALREDRWVREAAVVAREVDGDRRLLAYVVLGAGDSLTLAAMRERLGRRLPEHMIPTGLVILDALPLTANGKVDRRALPDPASVAAAAESAAVAPRTPTEEVLAAIWGEVLGVERVGVFDNFFDLGGHSLLATRVISQVRGAFQVEIGLQELFEEPTVAALAARVERAVGAGAGLEAPPIERVARDGELPLSFAQQRLWFIDQLAPGTALYNIPIALRASGELRVDVLSRALGEVVRRHEALRTVFAAVEGRGRQVILPPSAFPLPVVDLSGLPEAARETVAAELADAGGRAAIRPRERSSPARPPSEDGGEAARDPPDASPHRGRRLVDGRPGAGGGGAIRGVLGGARVASPGAPGAVRGLCVVAAALALGRAPGAGAGLLARASRRSAGAPRAAARPAAASGAELSRADAADRPRGRADGGRFPSCRGRSRRRSS